MLDPRDTLAIHELLALYGYIIDEREWHRVGELFTATTVYDMREFGLQAQISQQIGRLQYSARYILICLTCLALPFEAVSVAFR